MFIYRLGNFHKVNLWVILQNKKFYLIGIIGIKICTQDTFNNLLKTKSKKKSVLY